MSKKRLILIVFSLILLCTLIGCGSKDNKEDTTTEPIEVEPTDEENQAQQEPTSEPANIELPDILQEGKNSMIQVYEFDKKAIVELSVQEYLYGVVAGEVGNDWEEEVLKAQAIIARTFMVNYFVNEESTKYEGADISTDVLESQAYSKEDVNDAIKKAVDDTGGMIIIYDEAPIKAFFHSCSGGKTATAVEGLEHKEDLPYLQVVKSDDSNAPPENRQWSDKFSKEKLQAALASMEEDIGDFDSVEIGEKGPSGRALTLKFGNAQVSCPQLRLALSASEFRSTLLTDLVYEDNTLKVSGMGFGHGVGMPQWDAKQMAEDGATAEDIIYKYFQDVDIATVWK